MLRSPAVLNRAPASPTAQSQRNPQAHCPLREGSEVTPLRTHRHATTRQSFFTTGRPLNHGDHGANSFAHGWTNQPRSNQTPAAAHNDHSQKHDHARPLGCANARLPLLVPTAPPAKERKPSNTAWTVVARCGQHSTSKVPPPALAVKPGQQ